MKYLIHLFAAPLLIILTSSCGTGVHIPAPIVISRTMSPPFSNRIDNSELNKMKKEDVTLKDLHVAWIPPEFPSSVEVKGASGLRGLLASVRIPTGISISTRLFEALNQSLTVKENSANKLTIKIIKARSNFKLYSGVYTVQTAIVWGEVIFKGEFTFNGIKWTESFHFTESYNRAHGSVYTNPLDIAWDKTAIAIAISIFQHIDSINTKNQINQIRHPS